MSSVLAREGWSHDASASNWLDDHTEGIKTLCRLHHQHTHAQTGRERDGPGDRVCVCVCMSTWQYT